MNPEVALAWRSARAVRWFSRLTRPMVRGWFRFELRGAERLPPPPCLVVGNHSGTGFADITCLTSEWHRRFGETRPARGLTSNFMDLAMRPVLRAIGAMPASHENGLAALRAGFDVLVFPGGELDANRGIHEPRTVKFGRRRGYVKLALTAGVPIVPVATIGSHYTMPCAPGGELLACVLGLKRLVRAETVPLPLLPMIGLAAAAGMLHQGIDPRLAAAAVAAGMIPLPVSVTSEILPTIDLRDDPRAPTDPGRIEEAHRRVHGALQEGVLRLRRGRGGRLAPVSVRGVLVRDASGLVDRDRERRVQEMRGNAEHYESAVRSNVSRRRA